MHRDDYAELTPEQRLQRIAYLLSQGLLRLEQRRALTHPSIPADSCSIPSDRLEDVPAKLLTDTVR